MRYLKYEFPTAFEWTSFETTYLKNLEEKITIAEIGDREITPPVFSVEDDMILTPAVMKGTYAVDILWQTIEPIEEITAYEVYPEPCGIHTFSGLSHLYEKEFSNKFIG